MQEARIQLACYVRAEEAKEIQSLQQRLSQFHHMRISMQALMTHLVVTGLRSAENCEFIRPMLLAEKSVKGTAPGTKPEKPTKKTKPLTLFDERLKKVSDKVKNRKLGNSAQLSAPSAPSVAPGSLEDPA